MKKQRGYKFNIKRKKHTPYKPTEQEEKERISQMWALLVCLYSVEYCCRELKQNKAVNNIEQKAVKSINDYIGRWLKGGLKGMSTIELEIVENEGCNNTAAIAELVSTAALLPDDQIDWFSDLVTLLCVGATNRSPNSLGKVEGVKEEDAVQFFAATMGVPTDQIDWFTDQIGKLRYAAKNRSLSNPKKQI